VSGELVRIYSKLEALVCGLYTSKFDYTSFVKTVPDAARILRFPGMQNRLKTISNPLDNTCTWLPQVESYANWISRAKLDEHHGLLQVTGKPGSGKSTIMKKTYERVLSSFTGTKTCVAGFFFNKRGTSLEHSLLGMFRSLLYQILELHPFKLAALMSLYEEDEACASGLHLSSLQDIFRDVFLDQNNNIRTIIFVDALDECDEPGNRDIAYFFRQLTDSAYNIGVQLDVCLARRDFPTVFLKDCPEIKMERFSRYDIEHYISRQLDIAGFGGSDAGQEIRREIADKANGIFLWVVLVTDEIVKERDNGRNERYLLEQICHLPAQLDSLFAELLDLHKMSKPELRMTLRLFQWAILSTSSLRLREWHHILAFIRDEPPKSLAEWRKSIYYTQTDEQLEKQIRAISRGLVEVKVHPISAALSDGDGAGSIGAGAGSLDSVSGDSRIVQPIHESVRAFFLGGGEWLSEALKAAEYPRQNIASFSAEGHIAMMRCCFEYLAIEELQQYYEARLKHTQRSDNKEQDTRPGLAIRRVPSLGAASFGSSAGSHDSAPISLPYLGMKKATTFGTKSVRSEVTDLGSMSATSQILDEYPALESYAINRTFLHARLAQDGGANPMPIILLLYDGCYWKRWLVLQDNVTRTSSLLSLAVEQKLDTWVQYMVGCESLKLAEKEINDALSLAIRRRRAKAILILAAHGAQADLNQRLVEALKNGKTRQVFLVAMEQRQDRNMTNEQALKAVLPGYRKLLNNAIQRGDMPYASDLLNFGVGLPLHGVTRIQFDAPHFIPSALKLLVDYGADINEQDECGRTLVHIAVESGNIDLLRALVTVGADIHAKDHQGLTALHRLAELTQTASSGIFEHLISSGADVNEEDICGRTPLHLIAGNNDDGDAKHSDPRSIGFFPTLVSTTCTVSRKIWAKSSPYSRS
jgi:ankyrin repeat protein